MGKTATMELIDFIARSPSSFHAVDQVRQALEAAGYRGLEESEPWSITPGERCYVTRNASSLIAFQVPRGPWKGFLLSASHSDSPTFQIKENGELEGPEHYLRLNTERYGGMLCAPWLDRPLSVAGRALVRTAEGVESRLVDIDQDLVLIPSVAIHMNREANSGYKYDPKTDMVPLFGTVGHRGEFRALVARAAGAEAADLLGMDLFLYLRQRGTIWGAGEEFVSAPRLDDLQCAFGCLRGFLAAEPGESLPVYCLFDNEEVGSGTRQGADSDFLQRTLERLCAALGVDYPVAAANSFLVSADNAHAVHPNHPEYADPTHRPHLNGGVVIKHSASQRYTTDAVSQAVFGEVCRRAEVPVQHFANRSDLPGGSTLGNIALAHVSLYSVDIGLAQLAMHSPYETAGAEDTDHLIRAMTAYYSLSFSVERDGRCRF